MALLCAAMCLVRWVPLGRWRASLGVVRRDNPERGLADDPLPSRQAIDAARRIERGTSHLPFPVKCLPRAVALQWLLRITGSPSTLVVAMHATDRTGEHSSHAWVEQGGEILIGDCDRDAYRPLLTIDNLPLRRDG